MNVVDKSKEELLLELQDLKKEYDTLKKLYDTDIPLRQKSEAYKTKNQSINDIKIFESEHLKYIHELEVHQIELEMINTELISAKKNAELAEEKFKAIANYSKLKSITILKALTKNQVPDLV